MQMRQRESTYWTPYLLLCSVFISPTSAQQCPLPACHLCTLTIMCDLINITHCANSNLQYFPADLLCWWNSENAFSRRLKEAKSEYLQFYITRIQMLKHNTMGDVMSGNVYFSVSVRGWKQMTESFAREHFALRIKIGWLGLNLSKEQTQIPHSQTLHGSHLRCLWAVVEGDISLSCHLLQKPFSTSTGLRRICGALSKEAKF